MGRGRRGAAAWLGPLLAVALASCQGGPWQPHETWSFAVSACAYENGWPGQSCECDDAYTALAILCMPLALDLLCLPVTLPHDLMCRR